MRSSRTAFVLVLTFALASFVAACGASGDDDAEPTKKNKETSTSVDESSTTTDKATTTDKGTTTTEGRTTTSSGATPTTVSRPADAQSYVDALAATFEDDGSQVFTKPQATCVSGAYLDAIGVDQLKAAGLSPEDFAKASGDDFDGKIELTEAMGNKVFDQFGPCGIDFDVLFRSLSTGTLTPEQEACFDRILTPENLRRSFVADYTGQELESDPLDQLQECAPQPGG